MHVGVSASTSCIMDLNNYPPPTVFVPSFHAGNFHLERVPVAPYMLSTYALMRGRNQHYYDPLHHALYPAADRQMYIQRVWLPPVERGAPVEGLPRGAVFFWDPAISANLQPPQPLPAALHGGVYQPRRDQQLYLPYHEFIRQNPPSVGKNHYKGDMVWANFGYHLVEGIWIDPDSQRELYDAYKNPPDSARAQPNLPNCPGNRYGGPHIMTPQEQDEFYRGFVEEVTDECDGEGDPRAWYISPATFAQWATGAVSGDKYEEAVFEPPVSLQMLPEPSSSSQTDIAHEKLPARTRGTAEHGRIPAKQKMEMQFDVDTGSLLSGMYDVEENPSILESPLGVDIIRPPAAFNYSYPGVMHNLERHGYGAAWCDRRQHGSIEGDIESVASTPEVFTSDRARENMVLQDKKNGDVEYETLKGKMYRLREEGEHSWQETTSQMQLAQEEAEKRIELNRQVFFLKEHFEKTTRQGSLVKRAPSTHRDMTLATPPPTPTPKRQYHRYFKEAVEHETTQLTRGTLMAARLKGERQLLRELNAAKEKEREQLMEQLGIQSVDDISAFIPKKPSGENIRVQFAQ